MKKIIKEIPETEVETGTLYIVSTPIGNDDDITMRALKVLKSCDIVVCEEAKVGARTLHTYNLQQKMELLNEQNEVNKTDELIELLESGKNLSLISDCGTPVFADPGLKLVQSAIKKNLKIVVVPGPTSIMTGLVRCGFTLDQFLYAGFLSRMKKDRAAQLTRLKDEAKTVVILETPYRIMPLLEAAKVIMPDRNAYIGCNLTMTFETNHYGTFAELHEKFSTFKFKGEFVVIFEGATMEDQSQPEVDLTKYLNDEDEDESTQPMDSYNPKYVKREGSSYAPRGKSYGSGSGTGSDRKSTGYAGGSGSGGGYKREGGGGYDKPRPYNKDRGEGSGGGYKREGGNSYDKPRSYGSSDRPSGGGGYKREGGGGFDKPRPYNKDRGEGSGAGGYKREGGSSYDRPKSYGTGDRPSGGGFKREGGGGYDKPRPYNKDRGEGSGGGFKREGGSGYDKPRNYGSSDRPSGGGFKREGGSSYDKPRTYSKDRSEGSTGGYKRDGGFDKPRTYSNERTDSGERNFNSDNDFNKGSDSENKPRQYTRRTSDSPRPVGRPRKTSDTNKGPTKRRY